MVGRRERTVYPEAEHTDSHPLPPVSVSLIRRPSWINVISSKGLEGSDQAKIVTSLGEMV